eukprot:TRINITY_DN26759_c0_g1_i2.p2 TRINITY_DN26759_c0_g1~~TRINITY_DN26759_c0_g1_i2.p2  ORF type:complete len:195 (-),score=17.65 TRINITY_DN26759_c0_g1_i2:463-1047(-)
MNQSDWFEKSKFDDTELIHQWETLDKKVLKKARQKFGVFKKRAARKMTPKINGLCGLDTLAQICNLEASKSEKRKLDDFEYLLKEMNVAGNGLSYPSSWLLCHGDIFYQTYKNICYEDDFEVERIVDSFEINGETNYLVKFSGYEICFHDLMTASELTSAKKVLSEWNNSGKNLLNRLREAYNSQKDANKKIKS